MPYTCTSGRKRKVRVEVEVDWENLEWFYKDCSNGGGDAAAIRALVERGGFELEGLDVLGDLRWRIVAKESKS
jgi:hypothetical protein